MSKKKEENKSPKEKALEHVTNCLKHRIAPYSELISASACLPELEVPKDIIERVNRTSLMEMAASRKMDLYSSSNITEADLYSSINSLRYKIRRVLERYYMLNPLTVKLEINESGNVYIRCKVGYSRDGKSRIITADSLDELEFLLHLELDMIIYDKNENKPYEAIRRIIYDRFNESYKYKISIDLPPDFFECLKENGISKDDKGRFIRIGKIAEVYLSKEYESNRLYPNKWDIVEDVCERDFCREVTDVFYLLKGRDVSFKKDITGNYAYICCTIEYSGDGTTKEIIADSFSDFNNQLSNEFEILIERYEDKGNARDKAIANALRILAQPREHNNFPELIVPDDFKDFLDCRTEYRFDTEAKTQEIQDIWLFGRDPYIYGYGGNDIPTDEGIEKKLKIISDYLKSGLSRNRMLKPGDVTLEKNDDGNYTIFSCTIQYSRDGNSKTITADSEEELCIYMDIEREMLFQYSHNWSEIDKKPTEEEKGSEDKKESASAAERIEEAQFFVLKIMNSTFHTKYLFNKREAYNWFSISDNLYSKFDDLLECKSEEEVYQTYLRREWQLGKINWFAYHDVNEESDDRSIVAFLSLQCEVRNILTLYYMLKPVDISLETDEEGKLIYISCHIQYSRDGREKEIITETLADLKSRMELELALLMEDSDEYLELRILEQEEKAAVYSVMPSIAGEVMRGQLSDQGYELLKAICKSYRLALFGNKIEREHLRSQFVAYNKEKSFIQERDRLFELETGVSPDIGYFRETIERKLEEEKMYSSAEKLSKQIGYSTGQISKVRGKKGSPTKAPSKEFALRLGLAFHLPIDELKKFIASAGYIFPYDKKDWLIFECIQRGITDYKDIVSKLFDISGKLIEINEMIQEKDPELEELMKGDPYLDVLFSGNDELNIKINHLMEQKQDFGEYEELEKYFKDYLKLKLEIQ